MASNVSIGLALPEPLQDRDAREWFKRFEVCAAANEWNEEKKLKRLPTLLRGRAWAVYDALGERQTDTYAHLKTALLKRLSPDTEEDRLSAREELAKRRLCEEQESVDALAHDLEKLLDRASPGLPAEIRDSELRFHLINALPEKVAFQIKLLPKLEYGDTIPKARELLLIYRRAENPVNQVEVEHRGLKLSIGGPLGAARGNNPASVTATGSPGSQSTQGSRDPSLLQVQPPRTSGQGLQIFHGE